MNKRFNPEIHHRRSIRLKAYDYAQAGAYFMTIVVLMDTNAGMAITTRHGLDVS